MKPNSGNFQMPTLPIARPSNSMIHSSRAGSPLKNCAANQGSVTSRFACGSVDQYRMARASDMIA